MQLLTSGTAALGFSLTAYQLSQFTLYYNLLVEWNKRCNLTSVTDWEEAQALHFLDPLTIAKALPLTFLTGSSLLDVGTGAGTPGIPLKILFPSLYVTLIEATKKKVDFLRVLIEQLQLDHVEIFNGRAEDLGANPKLREKFRIVVARGLAKMPTLVELTLPFMEIGGLLVAQKKGAISKEVSDAIYGIEILGGGTPRITWVEIKELDNPRALVVIPKVKPTPAQYPRRPGIPKIHPLGITK